MSAKIDRIRVLNLHKQVSFDIPIRDNKIVLVGVNGLGKTTIVSMLYFFLTKQWQRLENYNFDLFEVTIDGEPLQIKRSDLVSTQKIAHELMRRVAQGDVEDVVLQLEQLSESRGFDEQEQSAVDRIKREITVHRSRGIPISPSRVQYLLQRTPLFRGGRRLSRKMVEISEKLDAASLRVLYLPTYRRIEQDLEQIFPGMADGFQESVRLKQKARSRSEEGFVELVEFGMRDVEESVERVTDRIRNTSRVEFSNLAGSYLRDVIRGEARTWDRQHVMNLSEDQASAIVSRVEENTLSGDDRNKIIEAIRRARTSSDLSDDDQLLAHFFWKLTKIFDRQRLEEQPIREFVNYCNKYLTGKRLGFDEASIKVTCNTASGSNIRFKDMSSGEKQIVSVFSQLLLEGAKNWFIVIDEPELSLSVLWQKQFLPDILATGKCGFIAAVTHSPFVFDNELEKHTEDLSQLKMQNAVNVSS